MIIRKPFYYGGVVADAHFCNRLGEINELITDIDTGLNVLLYAPRIFGKTSLVLNALGRTKHAYVFLDLMGIVDKQEFINEYFNAVSKSLTSTADKAVNLFKKILGLKPNISVDFDASGNPSFRLGLLPGESKNVLKEVLDLPHKYAQYRNQKVVNYQSEMEKIKPKKMEEQDAGCQRTLQRRQNYSAGIIAREYSRGGIKRCSVAYGNIGTEALSDARICLPGSDQ
ncbi:MAG: hypothetical protein R6T90_00695 [Dissulfuribacterales bacterium]